MSTTNSKKYTVADSVWIATALLTYEKYFNTENPSIMDLSFKQIDIVKRAQKLADGKVDNARVSWWCCSDAKQHTYNYLRKVGSDLRRLTSYNEFEGNKTEPTNLNLDDLVMTSSGEISLRDLSEFIHHEYADLVKNVLTNTDIDCLGILRYLEQNQGNEYTALDKVSEEKSVEVVELASLGRKAVLELHKMALLCENAFGLKSTGLSKWLDGSNTKIRGYLWEEMKLPQYMNSAVSISLFVHIWNDKKARYCICLETKNDKVQQELVQYHRFLDLPLDTEHKLEYLFYDTDNNFIRIRENEETVKEKIQDGIYSKVQLIRLIEQDDGLTNEAIITDMYEGVSALLPYYEYIMHLHFDGDEEMIEHKEYNKDMNCSNDTSNSVDFSLNTIIYGPPGTGKTYHTVIYAVAICDGIEIEELKKRPYKEVLQRYNILMKEHRIAFTTFHQSYGYEEFIEGIKPVVQEDDEVGLLQYKLEDGVFKEFCIRAGRSKLKMQDLNIREEARIWKVTIQDGSLNDIKKECFENGHVRIGFDINSNEAKTFVDDIQKGDLILSLKDRKTIDALGIVTEEEAYELTGVERYKTCRNVQWLDKNLSINVYEINGNRLLNRPTVCGLPRMKINDILQVTNQQVNHIEGNNTLTRKNYVFIIDEINRGNISRIFGELITLIEETKREGREEAMSAILPYTKDAFSVPDNVYLLGTMNTADRSIALLDTALRRRFTFIEAMPHPEILLEMHADKVGDIDVVKLLTSMNERVTYLYDRDHTIGHAYFTTLKDNPTIEKLAQIFRNAIIPLLQEYFYEDYNKIRFVLGDNGKPDELQFIREVDSKVRTIFKGNISDIEELDSKQYVQQDEAFLNPDSYIQIYS